MDRAEKPRTEGQHRGAGLQSSLLTRRQVPLLDQRMRAGDHRAEGSPRVSRAGGEAPLHPERLGQHLPDRAEGRRPGVAPMSALTFLAAASLMSAFTGQASGPTPELVGEGVLSTTDDETSLAVSPDGKTAYFGKRSPATYGGIALDVICVTLLQHGRWSPPEVA